MTESLPDDIKAGLGGLKSGVRGCLNDVAPMLTDAEGRVFKAAVTTGASYKEIAFSLNVSPSTVSVHVNNIFKKLKVSTRASLMIWALINWDFDSSIQA